MPVQLQHVQRLRSMSHSLAMGTIYIGFQPMVILHHPLTDFNSGTIWNRRPSPNSHISSTVTYFQKQVSCQYSCQSNTNKSVSRSQILGPVCVSTECQLAVYGTHCHPGKVIQQTSHQRHKLNTRWTGASFPSKNEACHLLKSP